MKIDGLNLENVDVIVVAGDATEAYKLPSAEYLDAVAACIRWWRERDGDQGTLAL